MSLFQDNRHAQLFPSIFFNYCLCVCVCVIIHVWVGLRHNKPYLHRNWVAILPGLNVYIWPAFIFGQERLWLCTRWNTRGTKGRGEEEQEAGTGKGREKEGREGGREGTRDAGQWAKKKKLQEVASKGRRKCEGAEEETRTRVLIKRLFTSKTKSGWDVKRSRNDRSGHRPPSVHLSCCTHSVCAWEKSETLF